MHPIQTRPLARVKNGNQPHSSPRLQLGEPCWRRRRAALTSTERLAAPRLHQRHRVGRPLPHRDIVGRVGRQQRCQCVGKPALRARHSRRAVLRDLLALLALELGEQLVQVVRGGAVRQDACELVREQLVALLEAEDVLIRFAQLLVQLRSLRCTRARAMRARAPPALALARACVRRCQRA